MTRSKKLLAVLLTAVTVVCMLCVPASAASVFSSAIKISQLETCSKKFKGENQTIYYKIVLNDSGTLVFRCRESLMTKYELYNSNAESIIAGDCLQDGSNYGRELGGRKIEIEKKGTYYLGITSRAADSNFYDLYYTFTPNNTPTISIALNVKVGDTFDFSAFTSNYTGKVTFKTTDSKIASVKSGTVTALKEGKARIRVYMNNGDYAEIYLVVKKK